MLWQFVPEVDYPVIEKKISTVELLWYLERMASGIAVAEFEKAVEPILIETMDIFLYLTLIKYFSFFFFLENREPIPAKHETRSH